MSTFYLLPPRPLLGARFADYLRTLFPGLNWADAVWPDLAEMLGAAASRHPDVYVIYREDLPEGEEPARALAEGFGAEAGDEVVEVRPGAAPGGLTARHWRGAPPPPAKARGKTRRGAPPGTPHTDKPQKDA